jgi:pectin methylesterase-like acyl-CoA thioesterase
MTSQRPPLCTAVWLIVLLSSCTAEVAPHHDDTDRSTASDASNQPGTGPRRDASNVDSSDSGTLSGNSAPRDGAAGRVDGGSRAVAADAGADDSDDETTDGGADEFDAGAQVDLPPGVSYLFPPPHGAGLCPDPALRIRFAKPPTLGSAGKIQVFEKGGSLVVTVDMAASTLSDTLGGTTVKLMRPVFVEGNEAVVRLKSKALSYGKSYYVTIDAGVFKPASGTFSISGETGWTFSTRAAPGTVSSVRVALDGSGDFCSVQGALDAVPSNNPTAAVVTLAPGIYHEVIHLRGKSNVTLRGLDRKRTVIEGTNNENLNPGTATRALVGFDGTNGLLVENLTIHNLTPQGGKQAEALRLQGCDKCIVRHADILSLQDTILWSGRIYATDLYVEGNVDYVWGTGAVYFKESEFRTVGRTGVLVQARNTANAYGYVFVGCKLTADGASPNNILARIDSSVYPASHVAFIDCEMNSVAQAGWTVTGGGTSALRFWEYGSVDGAGRPVSTNGRLGGSSQISSAQAAMMRDPSVVLNGWTPPD